MKKSATALLFVSCLLCAKEEIGYTFDASHGTGEKKEQAVIKKASVLQSAIDKAPEGSTLVLPEGLYKGQLLINKPLTLDGQNQKAVIDGEGLGHVIVVKSPSVVLKNLTVQNSGNNHNTVDSAISIVKSNGVQVLNNHIRDALFGIDFDEVHRSKIEGNYITSKDTDLGLRGDAIRLWYSNENIIRNNRVHKSRDTVIWYSSGNTIEDNFGDYCRYSLHFMYAGKNLVRNNRYEHNSVGIFFMYSSGTSATGNTIKSSIGSFGVGVGMKDTSSFTLKNNTIVYNARGLYIDQSPYQPNSTNIYENNLIAYNGVGAQFHATQEKSILRGNTIKGNVESVINDTPGSKMHLNFWEKNHWDDYEGFDRDKDGFGDIPFSVYSYADKLWQYDPNVKFFYGTPVISLLNFLARLAPFSEPETILTDAKPLMKDKDGTNR